MKNTTIPVMIYDDYIEAARVQKETYGERTVVFMQVGDFFELYAVENDEEKAGADIYTICDICNLQVSRKNKTILENSRQNPLMAGFPMAIVSKHIQTLVEHGYTVVVIRQVTPPPNPRREITEVISPATQLQPQGADHAYLMVLYWDTIPVRYGTKQFHWAVGMAAVDISTGDVVVAEALPRAGDASFAKDEAYRWIQMLQPCELVLAGATGDDDAREGLYRDLQIDTLRLHRAVHDRWNHPNLAVYQKPAYQAQLFEKLWRNAADLHLERNDAIRVALVHAVQFIYEHNEAMLRKMKLPMQMQPTAHCSVHYNALLQLNVLSHTPGERPLLSLLNRCSTAFGSRLFKARLLNPVVSKEVLTRRYDEVSGWINHPGWMQVKKHLGNILDLERFARRLVLRQLAPCEWVPLSQSLQHVAKVVECTGADADEGTKATGVHAIPEQTFGCLQDLRRVIDTYLHLEEAARYWMHDIRGSMFRFGHYPYLDAMQETAQGSLEKMGALAATLSALCGGEDTCKLENNDRYGYYLTMTKKRWEGITTKEPPTGYTWKAFKTVALSSSSSVLRITHPSLDAWSHTFLTDQKKLSAVAVECYKDFLETHGDRMASHLESVVAYVANLDVSLTNARNAMDFCYCRPVFGAASPSAYLRATAMRHPMIERIQTTVPYVPNDVALGATNAESPTPDGWLLYGINAAGKSSLMKAIGLNVLMAQAGMFVPCASLDYEPYHSIFTRISGADNLYRGMSSFTVEMTELRNILLRCDHQSLVLGDELCAGTEALSALSIVAAGVETLAERKASFVFATHLHELMSLGALPANVAVFHIHIHIDPETHTMTYDRHLTPGSGHPYYGLEVCRALNMPDAFLARAHHYRRQIQDEPETFLNIKPSNYNKAVFMDACAICSKPAKETHHIHYQRHAKAATSATTSATGAAPRAKKHVLHIPIHAAQNLVPLCDACHDKEHSGHLKIKGFRQTSMGRILLVDYVGVMNDLKHPDLKNDNDT